MLLINGADGVGLKIDPNISTKLNLPRSVLAPNNLKKYEMSTHDRGR